MTPKPQDTLQAAIDALDRHFSFDCPAAVEEKDFWERQFKICNHARLEAMRILKAANAPADAEALAAFNRVKVFCDVSTKQIAPFMVDAKKSLMNDLETLRARLQSGQSEGVEQVEGLEAALSGANVTYVDSEKWAGEDRKHYIQNLDVIVEAATRYLALTKKGSDNADR